MKKQSNPKTLGLLAFVVLVLGGGATYFQYNAVQAAKADMAVLEAQVPSQKELEKSLADSHSKLVAYQKQLEHLEGSVPDVAYIPTLMKELEQIGLGHGIKVTGVRPAPVVLQPGLPQEGKKKEKKLYSEVEIEVKGRGRYDDIKAFLDSLQKFPKVIAVRTISLTPIRESGTRSNSDIEAVINVVAYVFPFELITATNPTVQPTAGGNNDQPMDPPAGTDTGETAQSTSSSNTQTHKLVKAGDRK